MLFRWLRAHPLTTTHQLHHREFFHCYVQFISFVRKANCVRAPKSLPLGGEGTSGLFLQRALVSLIHQPETIGDPCVLCLMFFVYFRSVICFQLIVRLQLVLFPLTLCSTAILPCQTQQGMKALSICSPGDHLNANRLVTPLGTQVSNPPSIGFNSLSFFFY